MRKYGIYLAYSPNVELSKEGLGRHLLAFLQDANSRNDIHFVIACPSWLRQYLQALLENSYIEPNIYSFLGPKNPPYILKFYQAYLKWRNKEKTPKRYRIAKWFDH